MTVPDRPAPGERPLYFDLQADFGLTKHMGGRRATRKLVELCRIRAGQQVLEVGCGAGSTACYLARKEGCRVVGVDVSEKMVARSWERARRQGMAGNLEFRVADAGNLAFGDSLFDVVIDESVLAFVGDKRRAVSECVRVVKPGGFVGLNEVTWTRAPSPELTRYVSLIMAKAQFLPPEGWRELVGASGLQDVEVRSYTFDPRVQFIEEMRQMDLGEYARAWWRFVTQSIVNPAYRSFAREVLGAPGNILRFMRSIGYGIYVGRK